MFVKIRAFTKEGYHRDILLVSEKQVHRNDERVGEPISSLHSGLIGWGGRVDPKLFPEVEYFEVVIVKEEN